MPSVDGEAENRIPLNGEILSPANPPAGCVFHTRCHRVIEGLCDKVEPEMRTLSSGHTIKCHLDDAQLATPVEITADDQLATLAD